MVTSTQVQEAVEPMALPAQPARPRILTTSAAKVLELGLLLVAGALEGFVSPIEWWPLEAKLAVSGVTAVFLYIYLRAGAGRHEETPADEPTADEELLGLRGLSR